MTDDTDLSQWLEEMVKKTEDKLQMEDIDDTSEQARKLLESWSLQTESFQPSRQKSSRKKPDFDPTGRQNKDTINQKNTKPKMAIYRKLEYTPMLVAKKTQSNRPSVDPTLIMDARRKPLMEMKAQRLEREAAKAQIRPKQVIVQKAPPKVSVADVDRDIKSYKQKMAENMAQKQKELEERHRQSMQIKQLEESVQQSIAKENKKHQKKKDKEFEKQTHEINMESLKINLQLYVKTKNKRLQRTFYSLWVSRCSFKSQTYQRAAAFNNFQIQSRNFGYWKKRYYQRVRQKELDKLERRLRREKQCEDAVSALLNKNRTQNAFTKWSAKYKTALEIKIIEEQHRKRRALLINRIEEQKEEKEREQQIQQNNNKLKQKGNSANSSPKKGDVQLKPKTKIKPIKIDPKMEAMEKRAEEQRRRRLEKAQKEAEMAEALEREKAKAELEAQRKKKLEHQQFLEEEKRKRDEQKRKEEEFQRALERKKYITVGSKQFRLRWQQLNAFKQWAKILRIKDSMEKIAQQNYQHSLMKKGIQGIMLNQQEKENERSEKAIAFYNDKLSHFIFLAWYDVYMQTYQKEEAAAKISEKYLMKNILNKIIIEKRKRQKAKFAMAAKHQEHYILRACMRVWPIGCAKIRDEERKAEERENLMKKALQIFDELSDSDI